MSVTVESLNAPKEELRQVNDPVEREKMRDASEESRREISSTTASQEELDSAMNAATERRQKEKWTPEMQKTFDKAFNKRISKYTRQTREAQDRARAAEERLAETEKRQPGGQESQPGAHSAETEQRPANGGSDDEAEFQTRVAAAKTKYSDYEEVVRNADSKGVQIPPDFGQALKKLPEGPEVAYLLAKHPDVLADVLTKLKGLRGEEHKTMAIQLAQEIGSRLGYAQQFPRAKQFNDKLTALKAERSFKPLDVHKHIGIHMDGMRVLHEVDNGPEIVLYLAEPSNLAEAEALSKMSGAKSALAIAKLSAKLEGIGREAPRTRVGPPPRPVGGTANTSAFDPYKDQPKSHAQYMSWRKTQDRKH
jgi:hypothetical protein